MEQQKLDECVTIINKIQALDEEQLNLLCETILQASRGGDPLAQKISRHFRADAMETLFS